MITHGERDRLDRVLRAINGLSDGSTLTVILPKAPRSRKPAETRTFISPVELKFCATKYVLELADAKAEIDQYRIFQNSDRETIQALELKLRAALKALKTIRESSDGLVAAYAGTVLDNPPTATWS